MKTLFKKDYQSVLPQPIMVSLHQGGGVYLEYKAILIGEGKKRYLVRWLEGNTLGKVDDESEVWKKNVRFLD